VINNPNQAKDSEVDHTIKGERSKIKSEITVAEKQPDKQMYEDGRAAGNSLTTREMGTTGGTRQMDPGICFHPVYVNSHTQNICVINMANCRTKNTTTPDDEGSAQQMDYLRGNSCT
jgi:hypothetical protein